MDLNIKDDHFWIGITDLIVENEWIYASDRSPIQVSNWARGEPQGFQNENCVACYSGSHGLWADVPCTYAERFATCITFSGKLAEPRTQSAANYITGKSHQLHDSFWIGISDLNVEGEWIYPSDHAPVSLNHWAPSEPNSKENENCGLTWFPLNSLWGDYTCAAAERYVCEMPA
ncbi:hypothetical protein KUTeg_021290 [Tegillarca granosa]|uniref:C-type lectin domain-containing protein n=1 Tax=Tegillarca granosa TaxID=220873 RepID=A0ABQ9EAE1_TEGGR|nr:hypothetical protein KUTeg_021290 [Tegillarca granosa]